MEMKNLCGKIPVALHLKVRAEIEQREISAQQFIQQVIEEYFMEKGVNRMEARTIAVQVSEQLFTRLKNAVAWKGCKQKEFLISVIEKAIEEVEAEMKQADETDTESGEYEQTKTESILYKRYGNQNPCHFFMKGAENYAFYRDKASP